ncbi:chaperone protein dnaJ 20, chloroplastic-like [Cornus florida]|uniref:chaperone protein dnaJ 20, chloroplastic-like n=1 Tax=Cornus florida TaxID=4283 RepID=UPI00289EF95E|nr:chaperone protein dnaJ 20, chloroplastic-like [Cornus florida]
MDICIGSSLHNGKPVFSYQLPKNSRGSPKFNAISCRAMSEKASENESANLYKVLSLSSNNAGIDEIKRAYRTMALKYHPDLCHPSMKDESTRMFVRVNEAYKTLIDRVSREEYDYEMGLSSCGRTYKIERDDQVSRKRWEGQIIELRRRSVYREEQKDGSWGSRARARNRPCAEI